MNSACTKHKRLYEKFHLFHVFFTCQMQYFQCNLTKGEKIIIYSSYITLKIVMIFINIRWDMSIYMKKHLTTHAQYKNVLMKFSNYFRIFFTCNTHSFQHNLIKLFEKKITYRKKMTLKFAMIIANIRWDVNSYRKKYWPLRAQDIKVSHILECFHILQFTQHSFQRNFI